jgi:probable rRNA maturation factor
MRNGRGRTVTARGRPRGERRKRRPGFRVVVGDARGGPADVRGLAAWLTRIAPARARGIVYVVLASDARVRALNRTFRRRDYTTDVLSFPSSSPPTADEFSVVEPDSSLGEIVIARGVARRQARTAGHPELTELKVLALHGLLHLLGYDHEHDEGEMDVVERRLRRKGGLREGLIERGAQGPLQT